VAEARSLAAVDCRSHVELFHCARSQWQKLAYVYFEDELGGQAAHPSVCSLTF